MHILKCHMHLLKSYDSKLNLKKTKQWDHTILAFIFEARLPLSLIAIDSVERGGDANTSRAVFRPEGWLVLQGSTPREEGVL